MKKTKPEVQSKTPKISRNGLPQTRTSTKIIETSLNIQSKPVKKESENQLINN